MRCSVWAGFSPTWAGDEAEGVPCRVGEHLFGKLGCSELEHPWRGIGNAFDHHIQVHLLRDPRRGPGRRSMVRSVLKGQPRSGVVCGDHNEVFALVGDGQAQESSVEARAPCWVHAVDDNVVQASWHGYIVACDVRTHLLPSCEGSRHGRIQTRAGASLAARPGTVVGFGRYWVQ